MTINKHRFVSSREGSEVFSITLAKGFPIMFIQELKIPVETFVTDSFIECPEVAGKTIQTLKIYPDSHEGCEAVIEFNDGTAFSFCVGNKPSIKAVLYRPGTGTPQVLCNYDI